MNVKYHSLLRNIHLAVLVKYRYVREFGYGEVLKPLINDLQSLAENGICVTVDGETIKVKGSVVILSGDNLSVHGIGGFSPSFSSGRVCWHCSVSYNNLSATRSEEDCTVRTSAVHEFQVQSVLADSSLKSVYGVNGECCLSCLHNFDPVSCLPPDIMHDLLEGFMPYVVELVVKTLVREKVLTMKQVNESMSSFVYGSSDSSDKPDALPVDFVKRDKSVCGKAVEKWCLYRMLPLYIGHLIPSDSLIWSFYLNSRCICDIVLAPVINKEDLFYF